MGTGLVDVVDGLATAAGCTTISVEAFQQNAGAFKFYLRLGYNVSDYRDVVKHPCHPYDGRLSVTDKACPCSIAV